MKTKQAGPDYGNWVSDHMIKTLTIGSLIFAVVCVLCFLPYTKDWPAAAAWAARAVFLVLTGLCLFLTAYLSRCKSLLSYDGAEKIQSKVLDYLLSYFEFKEGAILDIGCGSGALSIKAAKRFPAARVTGIDFWEAMWNYAKEQCEANAKLENVADRVTFQKGDAAKLDFSDGVFDGAISNFVFHEVKSQSDKRILVKEALRVVKKGGAFAFHDLFLEKQFYGEIDEFVEELKKSGISRVAFVRTNDEMSIPGLLKTRFMLGSIGVLYGIK